jgi:uncharacterized alkaline shock family protein YloU
MMDNELRLGRIEVAPEAIATIAGRAVLGCYGVVGMSAKTLRDGLAILLQQENPYRGVEVQFVDRYKIIIDLYVVIEYGVRISEVAQNIMDAVKFAVEKALGLPVVQVNIHVQGLHISNAD